jgi:CheY-like chemotaxis protein/HPt (histidine-containing phosphotransfer) domain-containing protein
MNAEQVERLFQAFEQADTSTTRKYGGTGLGLVISKRLVTLMNGANASDGGGHDAGEIGVYSQPGEGSRFWFRIPLMVGQEQAAETPKPINIHAALASRRGARILLAEDNMVNQEVALALLDEAGLQADVAANGAEALRLFQVTAYDLVLMDMQMPVLGGIEATRLIRAHEAAQGLPRVPIMAMTANAMQGDREACLAAGMDDYLSKPINQVELAAKLRLFAPQGAPANAAPVRNALPEAGRAVTPAPTFDYAAALAVMDAEIIDILAPAFLDHYQNELASLRAGIAAGDSAEVMRRAHGLKGTLAAFGAEPAMRRAAEIETLAKAEDLAGLPPLLHGLEEEVAKLVAVLRR